MARKLNKKVIALILGVPIAAGLAVGGVYVSKKLHLFQPSIETLEKQGDEAFAAADYPKAKDLYGLAANRAKTNVPLQIKFVDAYDYCVNGDPDAFRQLRVYYSQIHTQDPRNIEVMRRILKLQIADVRNNPGNQSAVTLLQDTIKRILELNPSDPKAGPDVLETSREARKARLISIIEPWQRQNHVDENDRSEAADLAQKLYDENPNDGEAIYLMVRFLMQDIMGSAVSGNAKQVSEMFDAARKFADDVIKKTPENPDAYFAVYIINSGYHRAKSFEYRAKEIEFGVGKKNTVLTEPQIKILDALRKSLYELKLIVGGFIEKADQYAKPDLSQDRFLMIRSIYLHDVELRDRKLADQRYRQLIEELPNSRMPRVMYARFLAQSPDKIEDAIKLLVSPFSPKKQFKAIESMEVRNQEIIESLRLQVIRLTSMELINDEQKKQERLKEIEDAYKLLATIPNMPQAWMLRIAGGISMQYDRVSDAVEKLDDALNLIPVESSPGLEGDLRGELLYEDANAQLKLGQSGKARSMLEELTTRDSMNIRAQIKLLEIYISERDKTNAKVRLDLLKNMLAQNPILDQYEVMVLTMFPEELAEKYKTMKEENRQQRIMKMRTAVSMGITQMDEAIRIGRDLVAADPKDDEAIQLLFRCLLLGKGDRESARALIEEAIKANPNNKKYPDILKPMDMAPEDQEQFMQAKFNEVEDPFDRLMLLADYYRQRGKSDEAIKSAKEAQALKPNRVEAIDMEFSVLVQMKKYTEAEAMLERFMQIGDPAGNELRKVRLLIAKSADQPKEEDRQAMLSQAKQMAGQTAQKYKEIAAVTLLYAQLLHSAQEYPDAVEQYQQTLLSSPTNMEALMGLIRCQIASGRINEAKSKIESSREKFPGNRELIQLQQEFEISFGDPQNVLDGIQQAMKNNPQNPAEWLRYGAALEQVGNRKLANKDNNEATQFYARASKHWAQAIEKFPEDIRFTIRQARIKRLLQDGSGAESTLETFIKNPLNATKPEAFEALADLYVQANKLTQAEKLLKDFVTSLKEPPASTLLKLSYLYAQMNRNDDALSILDLKKDDPQIVRHRVELLIAAQKLEEARKIVEEELAKNPTPELNLLRGFIELRSGDNNKALLFLDKVLAVRPKDVSALFYRAQIRMNQSPPNFDGAREDLEAAIQADANNINVYMGLADVYIKISDKSSAINSLERAWEISNRTSKEVLMRLFTSYLDTVPPKVIDAQRLLDSVKENATLINDPEVIMLGARLSLASTGETSKAVQQAKKAVDASNGNPAIIRQYFDLLYKGKEFRRLLAESDPIVQKAPTLWWLYSLRGQAYRALEQRIEAGKAFDAALQIVVKNHDIGSIYEVSSTIADTLGIQEAIKRIDPVVGSDNEFRLLQANLYTRANEYEKSIEILQRIRAEKNSVNPAIYRDALNLLGSTCLQVAPKETSEALKVYEELLAINPDDVLLLNNLSFVNIMTGSGGSIEKAKAYSARAYDLSRSMPVSDIRVKYVEDTRGWVLYKSGLVSEGLDMLQQAAIRAKFPDVHVHLAEIYVAKDDMTQASVALKEAGVIIAQWEKDRREVDKEVRARYEELRDLVEIKLKTSENGIK